MVHYQLLTTAMLKYSNQRNWKSLINPKHLSSYKKKAKKILKLSTVKLRDWGTGEMPTRMLNYQGITRWRRLLRSTSMSLLTISRLHSKKILKVSLLVFLPLFINKIRRNYGIPLHRTKSRGLLHFVSLSLRIATVIGKLWDIFLVTLKQLRRWPMVTILLSMI